MLNWVGIDQPMKMNENSRVQDKKPEDNNYWMFGGASARIETYNKDINDRILPILRQKFGGIRMVVL